MSQLKFLVFFYLAAQLFINPSRAAEQPESDSDILSRIVATSVSDMIESRASGLHGTTAVYYSPATVPRGKLKRSVEAALTLIAFSVIDTSTTETAVCRIAITDASVTLVKRNGSYDRTVTATVHIGWNDNTGATVFADSRSLTATDVLSVDDARKTDDSALVIRAMKRTVVESDGVFYRFLSFLLLAGTLGYFAFQ